jgi:hypothetical protein
MKWASSAMLDFNSYQSGIGTVLGSKSTTRLYPLFKARLLDFGSCTYKKAKIALYCPNARLILAYRFERTGYLSRPFLRDSRYADIYLNQYSSIGSIGISHWDFYVDKNVYLLGIKNIFLWD